MFYTFLHDNLYLEGRCFAEKIRELSMEERPREKLRKYGPEYLSTAELLAILIGSGTKNKSSLELAHNIVAKEEKALHWLSRAIYEEINKIEGIGPAKACQIMAAIEMGKRISQRPKEERVKIADPESVASLFMEEMRILNKECFKLLTLNCKGEILSKENVATGTLTSAIVHPREVFNCAVRKSAQSIILVHNHPSGEVTPSNEDINLTKRLYEAGKLVGIEVLDHIIIGDGIYFSFKKQNLIL
ncbi:MAG: DNA repair protein RadC [Clostridiales bacterium]|nr:DNA repair protein RadC [Clostridiales bacterium]